MCMRFSSDSGRGFLATADPVRPASARKIESESNARDAKSTPRNIFNRLFAQNKASEVQE